MAQTNVQAFSGDVAISSNLAVDTNTLFVDSVGNKVGIGTTTGLLGKLNIYGTANESSAPLRIESGDQFSGLIFKDTGGGVQLQSVDGDYRIIAGYTLDGGGGLTGGGERMRIKGDTGNVGIGTNNPETTLQLHKEVGDDTLKSAAEIKFSTNNSANTTWDVGSIRGAVTLNAGGNGNYPGGLVFATKSPGGAGDDLTDKMVIDANGNVGIGTTIPLHALDVRKDVTTGSLTTTNLQTQFKIGNSTFTAGNALMGYSGRASHIINAATYWKGTGGYYGTTGYFGIAVNNNSTGVSDPYGITDGELESQTHLVIKHNGNVGIGTVIPLTTLDVNGPMQSYMGRHVKTVPVRHNAYSDIAGNGGTVRLGNQVVGGGAGYNGSLATGSWFGSNAIGNFSADRWVTPNRMRVCFKWGFVAGYYSTVTFKIWETLYTSGDSLKATFTSGNGSLSRGLTTVWGPDMTMVYGDVPGLMIEADSNASGNAGATIRISDIWLEYVYV